MVHGFNSLMTHNLRIFNLNLIQLFKATVAMQEIEVMYVLFWRDGNKCIFGEDRQKYRGGLFWRA